ncbi:MULTISPECIES: hypothetical protein [unclassified Mesorhizobium]|uniref:hypothetical protein n=1 Tax=unclassified Mesorhizobium TaxID=325217 RepID=UPI001FD99DA5|nr:MULTISPECIES: hypothetical protein [unclassified Mesorhizobium]
MLETGTDEDAAAYAGALEKIAGSDTATITAAATQSATDNGLGNGTITVHAPPTSGPNTAKKAVEVILNQNLDRIFTSIFSESKVPERARAVALITDAPRPVCWRSIRRPTRRRSSRATPASS